MAEKTKESVWWPFVQHASGGNVNVIDSASGDFSNVLGPSVLFKQFRLWIFVPTSRNRDVVTS
ncbi:hypothetical protein C8R42DRAFT_670764 [Lentinula raphanica]|nr:hypothetical protein C8R42DRAFT_670764 [Lentinula raphanica]